MKKYFERNFKQVINELITDNYENISKVGEGLESFKAVGSMAVTTNLAGGQVNVVESYWNIPAVFKPNGWHFRDLAMNLNSGTGQYVFYRTTAGEGSFGAQTPLTPKNQKDYDYVKVSTTLHYLAAYVNIARQMMQDLPFLESYLPQQLTYDFLAAEDDAAVIALNATLGLTVSAETTMAAKLLDFISMVRQNRYYVNGIAIDPTDYKTLLNTAPATSDYSIFLNPLTGGLMFEGVPVYPADWVLAGEVYVGDWNQVALITMNDVGISFSYENDLNFINNMVTVKIEQRENIVSLQPQGLIRGALV